MKHYFKLYFPVYFGPPAPADIDAKVLANAQSQMAQLLADKDILEGQIHGCQLTIDRLTQP